MKVHTLRQDLSVDLYERFLRTMLDLNASFSLVWRDQLDFSEAGMRIQRELQNVQVERRRAVSWPGTQLNRGAGSATVIRYRCSAAVLPVLQRPGGLFSWQSPDFPEDLAFYDAHDRCTVASVAHERVAWILAANVAEHVQGFVSFEFEEVDQADLESLRGAV